MEDLANHNYIDVEPLAVLSVNHWVGRRTSDGVQQVQGVATFTNTTGRSVSGRRSVYLIGNVPLPITSRTDASNVTIANNSSSSITTVWIRADTAPNITSNANFR